MTAVLSNLKSYEKDFSESKLRQKLEKVGRSIGATVLYPVLLLYNLFKSDEVNLKDKALIIGALGYFILPIDLIPDALVGVGYADDITALMAVLTALAACMSDTIQETSKEQLKNLVGDYDERVVEAISKIING